MDASALPVLRVAVLGEERSRAEFVQRVCRDAGWPTWGWYNHDFFGDDAVEVFPLCTPKHRLLLAVMGAVPRAVALGFDADALVLTASWTRPTFASGPPRMFGTQVFTNATPVLWLGSFARATQEERTLRGALRAHGFSGDAVEVVYHATDSKGERFAEALDVIGPHRPDDLRGIVRRNARGTVHYCNACERPLHYPLHQLRSHPAPQTVEAFKYNQHMFPGGGVFAYGANAEVWGRQQPAPSKEPHEVVLLDFRDLCVQWKMVGRSSGGCCGSIPADTMNFGCECGAPIGYLWSECAMYAVIVLRLDQVHGKHVTTES